MRDVRKIFVKEGFPKNTILPKSLQITKSGKNIWMTHHPAELIQTTGLRMLNRTQVSAIIVDFKKVLPAFK